MPTPPADTVDPVAELWQRVQSDPTNAQLWQDLGRLYDESGFRDEAESAYRKSLELSPTDPWTHLYLANIFYGRKRYEEALRMCESARALAPDMAMSYVCMANAYCCLGHYDKADELYRRAIEVDPNSPVAQDNLRRWHDVRCKEV